MDSTVPPVSQPVTTRRRVYAWAALVAAAAAVVAPLLFAGLRSLVLLAVGVGCVAVAAAGVWWALSRRGVGRVAGLVVTALGLLAVVAAYLAARFFWIVGVSLLLWLLALLAARQALRGGTEMREYTTAPPRRPYLIMNPRSGGGKVGRFDLVNRARALGAQVALLEGPQQIDVTRLARDAVAAGADLLGVAGGDGTQALVAGVAAEAGVPFMVISAGTRNHFALDLGLDREDPSRCLEALTDGVEIRIDLGVINGRPFVNNASFGAYAAVVQSPAYRDDKTQTTLRMLPDLLLGQSGPHLVAHAGRVEVDAPQAVLVSNNPYGSGDPAGVGRRPRLDSGTLGVVGVRVDNALQAAALVAGTAGGGVTRTQAPHVVVEADAPSIPVGVDGEALMLATPVTCDVRPGALRVRVPRHRPGLVHSRPSLDWHEVRHIAGGLLRPHHPTRPAAAPVAGPGERVPR
jgi:diacylglycerol kinase family enzyme